MQTVEVEILGRKYYFKSDDPAELIARVKKLEKDLIEKMWWCYKNPLLAKKMGEEGMEEVHANWTWDKASERLIEELKERGMYE